MREAEEVVLTGSLYRDRCPRPYCVVNMKAPFTAARTAMAASVKDGRQDVDSGQEQAGRGEYRALLPVLRNERADGSEHRVDRRRRAVRSVWQLNCAGSRATVGPECEKSDLSRGRHTPPSLAKRRYLPRAFGSLTAPAAAALRAALITTRRPVEIMEQAPLHQPNQRRQWLTSH
jgi:hypothetical protein